MSPEPLPALEILDHQDEVAVAAYERAFHHAFSTRAPGNLLVRTLWRWDDATGRVATRVPYHEQLVLLARAPDRTVLMAMAVNTAMRQLQSAAFGFALPAADAAGACEIMVLFVAERRELVRQLPPLCRRGFALLVERGFRTAFATTATRLLPLYRWGGMEVIESRTIGGEQRHLLRLDLVKAVPPPR